LRRVVVALGLIGMGVACLQSAQAQDGLPLLKKVQAAYVGLKSYSQKTSSTVTLKMGTQRGVEGQTTELRYMQPNRVYMTISSPRLGAVTSYNNGKEMLFYSSAINSFQKRPSQPTLKAYVLALREFKIVTMLDPLAFLTGEPVEAVLSSATIKPGESLNGASCNVVTAQIKPALLGKAKSGTVTFWADKGTNLLRKVLMETRGIPVSGKVKTTENGKPVTRVRELSLDQTVSITVQELQANPALNDSSFTFPLPKGAIEQNPDKILKK